MKALALDTSTDACTVALGVGDEVLVDHRVERQAHARLLLPMVEALLAEAGLSVRDLDGIAFGRGPGGFTGVRIAVAAAQGLALGADVGTVGVSTLGAIAQGCLAELGDRRVRVVVDARMGELYVGEYLAAEGPAGERPVGGASGTGGPAGPVMALVGTEAVVPPEAAGIDEAPLDATFAGSGIERYPEAFARVPPARLRPGRLPHARDVLALARARIEAGSLDDPANAVPVYLRDRVALTEAERGVGPARAAATGTPPERP